MGYAKVSVTIPDELHRELKELAAKNNVKVSHLVSDAIAEKARKMREEALIQKINEIFCDPELADEQHRMAETIADSITIEELPW